MAFVLKDRVQETTITTGTGPITLAGAVTGYQAFSAVCSIGDTVWYSINHSATSWEIGLGTYSSANTLTRTTVYESSNAGSAVSFASGTKMVFIALPASKTLLFSRLAPPVPGGFKNLSIKVASNTTVTVAADFVTTTDGLNYQTTAVASTVNMATTGVDALDAGTIAVSTWYAIWVVAKDDGTTKCVASTSATAPTLPAGYTFKARVGWVRTVSGSATLYGTWQMGRQTRYVVGLAQTTGGAPPILSSSANAGSWLPASVSGLVPATASIAHLITGTANQASGIYAAIAPNNSYTPPGGTGSTGTPYYRQYNGASIGAFDSSVVSILLESSNIYWESNTAFTIWVHGWEDNI